MRRTGILCGGAVAAALALVGVASTTASWAAPKANAGKPDLAVTVVDDVDPAETGSTVTYTASIQNLGSAPATEVRLATTAPDLAVQSVSADQGACAADGTTCSLGTLAPGASTAVRIRATSWTAGSWVASSSVSAAEADDARANNADAEDTTFYDCWSCPTITIQDLTDPVRAGEPVVYDIAASWSSSGAVLERGTEIVVAVPAGAEFVATSKSCNYADRVVVCGGGRENSVQLVLRAVEPGSLETTALTRLRGTTGSYSASATTTVAAPIVGPASTAAPVRDVPEAVVDDAGETLDEAQTTVDTLIRWVEQLVENLPICRFGGPTC